MTAALQHAGRGSELMGHARWWVDSRSEAAKEEAGQRQRQAEDAEAATAAAAAASGEVQAAQHASAVQAASRAETQAAEGDSSVSSASSSSSEGSGVGPAAAAAAAAASTTSSSGGGGRSSDKSSSAWHWRAIGRWAERVSSELRAQVGQVERLEKDQQHEAAVARLHEVLETYTDVTRFPK